MYGLTDSKEEHDAAVAFYEAAKADGWTAEATYTNEPESSAAKLKRDGFSMHVLMRMCKPPSNKFKYQAEVSIWGPDRLCVDAPKIYSMEIIVKGLRRCHHCKREDVDVTRYGFAGRCCAECLPAMRRTHEYEGWTK